jgi:hypothetical protein
MISIHTYDFSLNFDLEHLMRYIQSPPVREPSPLQLEYPINKIYDLRPFKDLGSEFLEFVMSGVVIDVVIPVLRAFKFYTNACVIPFYTMQLFHRRNHFGKSLSIPGVLRASYLYRRMQI